MDDLVARYETVTGKPAVPAEMYDGLALSTKTTLNAVTHALSRTPLTDSAGRWIFCSMRHESRLEPDRVTE